MEETCGTEWPNVDLPYLPHRCVIVLGWHVNHACHCGAILRVSDEDLADNAHRFGLAEHVRSEN